MIVTISIGIVGKIIKGEECGSYAKIIDDTDDTGGYLILVSKNIDLQDGYDSWVQDWGALTCFFQESSWEIDWSLPNGTPRKTPPCGAAEGGGDVGRGCGGALAGRGRGMGWF
jgi:hypothetical protein